METTKNYFVHKLDEGGNLTIEGKTKGIEDLIKFKHLIIGNIDLEITNSLIKKDVRDLNIILIIEENPPRFKNN